MIDARWRPRSCVAAGARGWLVGGTVRDRRSGRFSPDLDIVVAGRSPAWRGRSPRDSALPGSPSPTPRRLPGDGRRRPVDVAALQGAGIMDDLAGAISRERHGAPAVAAGTWSTRSAGRTHLRQALVAVSDHIFRDDPSASHAGASLLSRAGPATRSSLADLLAPQAGLVGGGRRTGGHRDGPHPCRRARGRRGAAVGRSGSPGGRRCPNVAAPGPAPDRALWKSWIDLLVEPGILATAETADAARPASARAGGRGLSASGGSPPGHASAGTGARGRGGIARRLKLSAAMGSLLQRDERLLHVRPLRRGALAAGGTGRPAAGPVPLGSRALGARGAPAAAAAAQAAAARAGGSARPRRPGPVAPRGLGAARTPGCPVLRRWTGTASCASWARTAARCWAGCCAKCAWPGRRGRRRPSTSFWQVARAAFARTDGSARCRPRGRGIISCLLGLIYLCITCHWRHLEGRHTSQVRGEQGHLLVRRDVHDPLDPA